MKITWDKDKNEKLKCERGISFEYIVEVLGQKKDILGIVPNPSAKYPHQKIFVVRMLDYTWAVPFVETDGVIKLVTAFKSRKMHKTYEGR